jgi:hypothetical protein
MFRLCFAEIDTTKFKCIMCDIRGNLIFSDLPLNPSRTIDKAIMFDETIQTFFRLPFGADAENF